MKVDRIVPYGKTRSRVLFAEGLALLFYNGELPRLGLAEGAELTEEEYERKILPLLTRRAKERLVSILKASDKTEAELRRRLKEGFYPPEAVEAALAWAREKHYADDRRYAETYLRWHSEGRSRKKLLYDLQSKGLDRELVEELLEETEVDEEEQIRAELARRHFSPEMDAKEKQRIFAALARKGYSWEQVRRCVPGCDL